VPAEVVSLGERLRHRREELGLSQSEAARELDVARTAYRLWEMEAAKPAPDRWRLIARWLGVSVATMLLAQDLIDAEEASEAETLARRSGVPGTSWDELGSHEPGTFFAQERATIAEQGRLGRLSTTDSVHLSDVLSRVERATAVSGGTWAPAELRKTLVATDQAPALARSALLVTVAGIPAEIAADAEVLVSELVTNSVVHADSDTLTLWVRLGTHLHVEVADDGTGRIRPRALDGSGGWGLEIVGALADRWGAGRVEGRNVAWFELDL
jgi:transcriptional regulator with XRE-family HTH domain/anti-sigma regulatory factor (Ser/Thr protein kinase)